MPWESPARAAPDCWSSPGAAPIPSVCIWAEPVNSVSKVRSWRARASVLEGRYGYYNAFSLPPKLDRLLDGLGTTWAIQPLSLKSYPTHVTHQAVVQAIQELKQKHSIDPQAITRIVIRGDQHIMDEARLVAELLP